MLQIIMMLETLAQDKGDEILTDDIIRGFIEGNIDLLVDEIKKEMGL